MSSLASRISGNADLLKVISILPIVSGLIFEGLRGDFLKKNGIFCDMF
jgi:hypothetical protein